MQKNITIFVGKLSKIKKKKIQITSQGIEPKPSGTNKWQEVTPKCEWQDEAE